MNDFLKPIKAEKLYNYTPDYDFTNRNDTSFIPVLVGNYYWTGAYIFYIPDVSDLDVKSYGYQCDMVTDSTTRAIYVKFGDYFKAGQYKEATDYFISLVNSGQEWEHLTNNEYAVPYIQHGKPYNMVDSIPTTYAEIKSVSISPVTVSATVGAAFSQQYNTACEEGDDGSYSYLWSASGSVAGLSLSDATSASPVLSGVPTTSGNAYLTVTVTDSYGNKATDETEIDIASAPVEKATLTKLTISPKTYTDVSEDSTESYVFTLTPDSLDDGSYIWSLRWQGSDPVTGGSQTPITPVIKDGVATVTITGPFVKTGNFFLSGSVSDTHGNTQTILNSTYGVFVIAPVKDAVLTSASANANSWKVGDAAKQQVVFVLDDTDDGSYTYVWGTVSGSGTGAGYIYEGDNTSPVSGSYTNSPVFYWDTSPRGSTVHTAGSPTASVTITDSAGDIKTVNVTGTVS